MLYAGLSAEALEALPPPSRFSVSVREAGAGFARSADGRLICAPSNRAFRTIVIEWRLLTGAEKSAVLAVVGAGEFYLSSEETGGAAAFRTKKCEYALSAKGAYELRISAEEV